MLGEQLRSKEAKPRQGIGGKEGKGLRGSGGVFRACLPGVVELGWD